MNKWYTKEVKINDKEHTKEMKDETVGAVRERERERATVQQNKYRRKWRQSSLYL